MNDEDGKYVPHQHQSKPLGCTHETIFASVELWVDDPPDVIEFGCYRYVREGRQTKNVDV